MLTYYIETRVTLHIKMRAAKKYSTSAHCWTLSYYWDMFCV